MLIDGTKTNAAPALSHDAQLLAGVAARDEQALRVIIEIHGPWVLGVAQAILGARDLAADIVQETMLEVWDRPGLFKMSTPSLRENLRIMARAKAIDEVRSLYDANAASRRSAAAGRSSARYEARKPSRCFGEANALPA